MLHDNRTACVVVQAIGHITSVAADVTNAVSAQLRTLVGQQTSFLVTVAMPLVLQSLPAFLDRVLDPLASSGTSAWIPMRDVGEGSHDTMVALRFLLQRQGSRDSAERRALSRAWSIAVRHMVQGRCCSCCWWFVAVCGGLWRFVVVM